MNALLRQLRNVTPIPIRAGYHWLRDAAHHAPRPWHRVRSVKDDGWSSSTVADKLRHDGICIVEAATTGEELARLQAAAANVLATRGVDSGRGKFDANHLNFREHPIFAEFALRPLVLAAVEDYYRRPVYLAHVKLPRLEPVAPYDADAFQWHHDAKGKYVKAMWLLTDLPEDGQRMSFMNGSHRQWRAPAQYEATRETNEGAAKLGIRVECAGKAGSVIVFDTNGIHRGNRNAGPRRDVLLAFYTVGRYLSGCRFDLGSLPGLNTWQRAVLERSRHASRGYAVDGS